MKIAFWAPLHGCGTTADLMAVMLAIASEHEKSVLLSQTHYDRNDLEGPLTGHLEGAGKADFFFNMGIDALVKYFKSGLLSKDIIESCTIEITKKISLLSGTRQSSRAAYDNDTVGRIVEHVFEKSEEYYDMVAIDVDAGYSQNSCSTLEKADIVVVNLRQNLRMIDDLFKNREFSRIDPSKVFYLFGCYDQDSKYNLTNLRHIYSNINSSNSSGIRHNTGYLDAICDRRAVKFINSGLSEKGNTDKMFFKELENTSKRLSVMIKKAGGEL